MSLINEALKKAQSERPSSVHSHPAMQGMPVEPQQKPPRKRKFLFGFILAVLVVALLSTAITTFLVHQILGDEESSDSPETTKEVATVKEAETKPPPPAEQEEVVDIPEPVAAEPEPETPAETVVQEEPEPEAIPEPVPVPEPTPQVASTPTPPPVVEEPAPQVASYDTNPQVWNRLEELEIRGIMSGGAKVLIFDNRTNKARAYKPGDLVDGALSLKVSSISNTVINFVNDDGSIFPKPF